MGSPLINDFIQNYKEANNFYNGLETDVNEILAVENSVAQGNIGSEQEAVNAWNDLQQLKTEYPSLMSQPGNSAISQLTQVQDSATTLFQNTAIVLSGEDPEGGVDYITSGGDTVTLYQLVTDATLSSATCETDYDGYSETFSSSDLQSMANQGQFGVYIQYDPNGYTYNNFTNALNAFQNVLPV